MNPGLLFLIMLFGAGISAAIAANKNRNVAAWLLLGACFPLISILIVASLDTVRSESEGGA